jgi:hypothetical protein
MMIWTVSQGIGVLIAATVLPITKPGYQLRSRSISATVCRTTGFLPPGTIVNRLFVSVH